MQLEQPKLNEESCSKLNNWYGFFLSCHITLLQHGKCCSESQSNTYIETNGLDQNFLTAHVYVCLESYENVHLGHMQYFLLSKGLKVMYLIYTITSKGFSFFMEGWAWKLFLYKGKDGVNKGKNMHAIMCFTRAWTYSRRKPITLRCGSY